MLYGYDRNERWECSLRKKHNLLFILFTACLLVACNTEDVKYEDDSELPLAYFTGTIEEILTPSKAIVISDDDGGHSFVNLSVNKDATFQVGDRVKVGFDGEIMESHPARIKTKSVELIE